MTCFLFAVIINKSTRIKVLIISPRFHVSANANVIRKCNHALTLSVIMSSVFPCIRFNCRNK